MPILFAMGLLAFMMTGPKKESEVTEVVEFTTEVINDENIAV
ncbi:hypothetical protein [Flammeovirga pectinis]|nr:hypothetical protein [Flammeovirga pectinis]